VYLDPAVVEQLLPGEALDGPAAMDLAVLTALGLACCAALLEPGGADAAFHLARATELSSAAPAAIAALPPPWRRPRRAGSPEQAVKRESSPEPQDLDA
jgi:hypothetical protein